MSLSSMFCAFSTARSRLKARLLSDKACSAVLDVVSTPVFMVTRDGEAVTVPLPDTFIVRRFCAEARVRVRKRRREGRI